MAHWKKIGARALREARRAVGLDTWERALFVVLAQVAVGAGVFFFGTSPSSGLLTRVLTAAAPFLLLPAAFLLRWLALPPRMAAEAEAFANHYANVEARRSALTGLAETLIKADNLKRRVVTSAEEVKALEADYISLKREMSDQVLAVFGEARRIAFVIIPSISAASVKGAHNETHNDTLLLLSEYTKRVRDLVNEGELKRPSMDAPNG